MKHTILRSFVAKAFLLSLLFSMLISLMPIDASGSRHPLPAQTIGEIVLTNAVLIDGNGRPPKPNRTLVISQGRIVDIYPTGSKRVPAAANVIDLTGKFVIPGMIDSHVHLMTRERPPEVMRGLLRAALLGGVTSVRDMGGNVPKLAELKADFEKGSIASPQIYYSAIMSGKESRWFDGSYLSFASNGMPLGNAPWARAVTDESDVVPVIAEGKATGATAIKIYSHLSPEIVRQLTAEAHRQNMKVWSHSLFSGNKPSDLVNGGVDALSHADGLVGEGLESTEELDRNHGKAMNDALHSTNVESKEITELLRSMKREGVVLDATLLVVAGAASDPANPNRERHKKQFEFACAVTRRAKEMGVTVAAGTDALGGSSPNLHAELQLLVKKSGFTPLEAITAATLNGAKAIGIEKEYGTLEIGKVADLVILAADPAEDIRNTQTVEAVMQGGKVYKRDAPMRTPPMAESPVSVRIRNVENGLLPAVVIKNKKNEMSLAERMQFYKTPGVSVAVVNNGVIEWVKGYGSLEAGGNQPVTPETLFQAGSISKPIAAVAAMQLVEKNKLNLDEDVNLKLRSWKVPDNEFTKDKKVTLRGLVTHSAGLTVHGFDGYAANENPPTLLQIFNGEKPANSPPIRVDFTPGSKERYSGGGYTVLQQLLLDATRKSFVDLTRENIFQKIGMSRSTYTSPLPKALAEQAARGHRGDGGVLPGKWHVYPEMAAASLWSTPSDLARFVIEMQNSYAGQSDKILSKDMTRQMLTRQNKTIANSDAGLGIFLKGSPEPFRFSHNGSTEGYNAIMVGFLKTGQGAVVMTNSDNGAELSTEILRSIAREYSWDDMKPDEITIVEANPTVYEKYVGRYKFPSGLEFIVTSENGRLFVARTNGWRAELLPESETSYFVVMPGAPRLVFVKNEQNEFNTAVFKRGGREEIGQRLK